MKNYFIRIAITLCLFAVSVCTTFAATITWTGGGTTPNYWNNPANWSSNSVPLATDDVIVNFISGKRLVINTAVTRSGTTAINQNAQLDIQSGSLTNSGTITMSSPVGICYLSVFSGGTLTNSGTINILTNSTLSNLNVITNSSTGIINLEGTGGYAIWGSTTAGTTTNNGTINLKNISSFESQGSFTNNGVINTQPAANLYDIQLYVDGIAGTGSINNNGVYTRNRTVMSTTSNTFTNGATGQIGDSYNLECLGFTNGLTSTGKIHFDIKAGVACTNFDRITVTGTAALAGSTFDINEYNIPLVLNSEYVVLTATTTISGSFTNTSLPVANGFAVPIINNSVNPKTLTIKIQATAALPVELVTFKGEKRNRENVLFWETASETNNRGFEVEISNDGSHFEKMAFVKGRGNTSDLQNYNFTHTLNAKQNGVLYYRLKQLDNDGKFEYSKIIALSNGQNTNVVAYPNPSKGEFTLLGTIDESATYEVFNTVGKTINTTIENNQLNLSDQPSGVYYLKINEQVVKLVKK